jgi:CheY-like chemotaxis protein
MARMARATNFNVFGNGGPSLAGLRVLVVDDEPDARELLRALLGMYGIEVHVAASAAEALDGMEQFKPDVLVSDIGMPGEDGYGLIRRIRESRGRTATTPAVALTAYARREDRLRALGAGFDMHMPKPVEPGELLVVLASLGGRLGDEPKSSTRGSG